MKNALVESPPHFFIDDDDSIEPHSEPGLNFDNVVSFLARIDCYDPEQPIVVREELGEPFTTTPREARAKILSFELGDHANVFLMSDDPQVFWTEAKKDKQRMMNEGLKQIEGLSDDVVIWYETANHYGSIHSQTVAQWRKRYEGLTYEVMNNEQHEGGRHIISVDPDFNPGLHLQQTREDGHADELEEEGLPKEMTRDEFQQLVSRYNEYRSRLWEFIHEKGLDWNKPIFLLTFFDGTIKRASPDTFYDLMGRMKLGTFFFEGPPKVEFVGGDVSILEDEPSLTPPSDRGFGSDPRIVSEQV